MGCRDAIRSILNHHASRRIQLQPRARPLGTAPDRVSCFAHRSPSHTPSVHTGIRAESKTAFDFSRVLLVRNADFKIVPLQCGPPSVPILRGTPAMALPAAGLESWPGAPPWRRLPVHRKAQRHAPVRRHGHIPPPRDRSPASKSSRTTPCTPNRSAKTLIEASALTRSVSAITPSTSKNKTVLFFH